MRQLRTLPSASRRTFLAALGVGVATAAGATLLAACGAAQAPTTTTATANVSASSRPASVGSVSATASTSASVKPPTTTAAVAAPTAASAAAGQRTLTIWHIWNGTREPLMKKIGSDFTAQHPTLAVEEQVITTDLLTKITAGIAAGAPCDMAMINQGWVPAMASQSAIDPLDPLVARDKLDLTMFYDSALAPGKWDGKLYVLPNLGAGAYPVLFYNKDLFAQKGVAAPPATWAQLQDVAQKLTITQGGAITQLGGVPAYSDTTIDFIQLLVCNNGKFLSADNRTYTFNDAPGLDVLTFYRDFYNSMGGGTAVAAFKKNQGTGEKNTPLYKGTQAMDISGIWYIFQIKNDNPSLNYGIAPTPVGPQTGAKYQSPNTGQWSYGIPKGVKSVDDSWLLTQWFTTSKDAGWFMEQQLRPSPLKAVNEDPYYQQQTEHWPEVVKLLPDTIPVGPTPVDPDVGKLLSAMMSDVSSKKTDPTAALENTQKQAQALLDKWYAEHPNAG